MKNCSAHQKKIWSKKLEKLGAYHDCPVPGQPLKLDDDLKIEAVDDDRHGRVYQILARLGLEDWQQHCGPKASFLDALEVAQQVQRRERAERPEMAEAPGADYQRDADLYYRGDQVTPVSHPDGRIDMPTLAAKIRRARQLKGLRA